MSKTRTKPYAAALGAVFMEYPMLRALTETVTEEEHLFLEAVMGDRVRQLGHHGAKILLSLREYVVRQGDA